MSPYDLGTLLKSPNPGIEDDLTVRGRMSRGGLVTQPTADPQQAFGDRLRALVSQRDALAASPLRLNAGPESTGPVSANDRVWDYMRMQQGVPALAAAASGETARMPTNHAQAPPSFETDWLRENALRKAAGRYY